MVKQTRAFYYKIMKGEMCGQRVMGYLVMANVEFQGVLLLTVAHQSAASRSWLASFSLALVWGKT